MDLMEIRLECLKLAASLYEHPVDPVVIERQAEQFLSFIGVPTSQIAGAVTGNDRFKTALS